MPLIIWRAGRSSNDRAVGANPGVVVPRLAGAIGLGADGGIAFASAAWKVPIACAACTEGANGAEQSGAVGAHFGVVANGQALASSGLARRGLSVRVTGVGRLRTRRKFPAASTGGTHRAHGPFEGSAIDANLGIELAR